MMIFRTRLGKVATRQENVRGTRKNKWREHINLAVDRLIKKINETVPLKKSFSASFVTFRIRDASSVIRSHSSVG